MANGSRARRQLPFAAKTCCACSGTQQGALIIVMNLRKLARKQSQMEEAWLASLGRDHAQRVNSISAMYEERRATLTSMAFFRST